MVESYTNSCQSRLETAKSFREVYALVKDTVKRFLGINRGGMLLFLDDLPLQVGAYHQVSTNNLIMNRHLLDIIQAATDSRLTVNVFIYLILLHEYLHALGYLEESDVKSLVIKISAEYFGEDCIANKLAKAGSWSLLKGLPLDSIEAPTRIIKIVKDFGKTHNYIV